MAKPLVFIETNNTTARWSKTLTCVIKYNGEEFDYLWYSNNLNPPNEKKVAVVLTDKVNPWFSAIAKRLSQSTNSQFKETDSAITIQRRFVGKPVDSLPYIPPSRMKWNDNDSS